MIGLKSLMKSKGLLASIGCGFFTLALLQVKIPLGIMTGLIIFASIIQVSEHILSEYEEAKEGIEAASKKLIFIHNTMFKVAKFLLFFSVPISIIMSILLFDSESTMTPEEMQQFLTLYSLTLVFFSIASDYQTKKDKRHEEEINRLTKIIKELTIENNNNN